ncbi:MAG: helix-turn-helix domain-containing protein [Candidatus Saccharimonadales bacterium]
MKKIYTYVLTDDERIELQAIVKSGKSKGDKLKRAQLILKAEAAPSGPGLHDYEVAEALGRGRATVERMRTRICEEGPLACLLPKKRARIYARLMDGDLEAKLVAVVCSTPPDGYGRWSLSLLVDQMISLQYVPTISDECIRRTLKKMNLSLG